MLKISPNSLLKTVQNESKFYTIQCKVQNKKFKKKSVHNSFQVKPYRFNNLRLKVLNNFSNLTIHFSFEGKICPYRFNNSKFSTISAIQQFISVLKAKKEQII